MPLYDNPIASASQDEYGRKGAALRCARTLTSIRSDSAFVVGLSGPWGSGKTSFVNMVKEALRSSENEPIIVDFNAWLYSSQEQLVRQFFSELSRAMGSSVSEKLGSASVKELGNVITEYSDALSEIGVNAASALVPQLLAVEAVVPFAKAGEKYALRRMLQGLGSKLKGTDKTIEQLRSEISGRLSKLDENIVVIIDDVDRLPQEDIRALFKLVNLTASFPRMTYLLAYDANVVCRALADVQGTDGLEYLEKIVQLPMDLPKPTVEMLRVQLERVIGPYFETQRFELRDAERTRLLRMFNPLVMRRIETPRQAKRYLNKLENMRSNVGSEVCPVDIMGMTGILLFYPTLASWIWANREQICTTDSISFDFGDSKKALVRESLEKAVLEDAAEITLLTEALSAMFPKVSQLVSDTVVSSMRVGRETGRVAHISNLELVFGTADGLGVRKQDLIELATTATEDELSEGLVQLDGKGELSRLIETIEVCRPGLTPDRKEVICKSLLSVIGRLHLEVEYSFFRRTDLEKTSILLATLLRDVGIDLADELVGDALSSYHLDDFVGISWFLRDELDSQSGEGLRSCLSAERYSDLARAYIDSIVSNYPRVLCLPPNQAKFFWRYLDESFGGNALQTVRDFYGGDTAVRILYSASGLSHWNSGYADGYGYSPSLKDSYEDVFQAPEASEVVEFSKTSRFKALPDEVKIQVAALYLLQKDGESGQLLGDRQVTRAECEEVVAGWES